jgi:hypothetical protein
VTEPHNELDEWIRVQDAEAVCELVTKHRPAALASIERIRGRRATEADSGGPGANREFRAKSELADEWASSASGNSWLASLSDLKQRLING